MIFLSWLLVRGFFIMNCQASQSIQIFKMNRPLFILGSRHGTIFNVTPALLSTYKIQGIQLFVGDFYQNRQTLINLPNSWSIKTFLGLSQSVKTYLTPYDFLRDYPIKNSNQSAHIRIQTDSGFVSFDAAKYNQMAAILKPDYLVGLTDYGTHLAGKKQQQKSLKRELNYLSTSNFKDLAQHTKVLLPLHVGPDIDLTLACLDVILQSSQIKGIVLCNLFEDESPQQRAELFNKINRRIESANKVEFEVSLGGQGKLSSIDQTIHNNIAMYEINYPFHLAAQNTALVVQNESYIQKIPELKEQLSPLSRNCLCYSCSRHSQAYIAHLINCKQPNATILLCLHNLQVYFDRLATFT